MNDRLFISLGQQLRHELFFLKDVSKSYFDNGKELKIIDFKYKSNPFKLVLNGTIKLKGKHSEIDQEINSFQELVLGLRQSTSSKKITSVLKN